MATGWEPELRIVVDGVISRTTLLELVEAFYAIAPPTRLKLIDSILAGTLESLTSGRADLAIRTRASTAPRPVRPSADAIRYRHAVVWP